MAFIKTDKSRPGEFLKFYGQGMNISNRCSGSGMYTSYGYPLQHADAIGLCLVKNTLPIVLSVGRERSIIPVVS